MQSIGANMKYLKGKKCSEVGDLTTPSYIFVVAEVPPAPLFSPHLIHQLMLSANVQFYQAKLNALRTFEIMVCYGL